MKEYQRKKNNKYMLPHTVYQSTIWLIRDYYRQKQEMDEILLESPPPPDGMPSGHALSNEPAAKAQRRAQNFKKTTAIENGLLSIPEEYRSGVWNNVQYGKRYPDDADRHTYGRYKAKFIYEVALGMEFIEKK